MAQSKTAQYTILPPLIQSPNDKRTYSLVKLANEMEILMISDPDAEVSACAIKMTVGSLEEPAKFPGLAHFLEHMLFLGSKKYPDALEYSNFFTTNSGYSNAFTDNNETVYSFECSHEGFPEALDRTCDFFRSPLFDETLAQKEVNAVNSEFENSKEDD
jgi:protease-3